MLDFIPKSITNYCERAGNTFLSEPINVISNLAFFVSAFFVYKLYKDKKVTGYSYWFLFFLLLVIGVGSSSWHSFRNSYTLAFDALPVFVFLLVFIFLLLKKLLNSNFRALIVVLGLFIFQIGVSYLFPNALNGSIRHFVFITFFIILGILIYRKNPLARKDIILALAFYSSGIIFRSIDNQICTIFPYGTHFLWHILNAAASYFAIKVLLNVRSFVKK